MADERTHSKRFEKVKGYYESGRWNADAVRLAATRGWITQDECVEILGEAQ